MHREKCAHVRMYVSVYVGSNGSKERHGALLVLMADLLHTGRTPRRYRRITSNPSTDRKDDFIPTMLDNESVKMAIDRVRVKRIRRSDRLILFRKSNIVTFFFFFFV